MAEHIRDEYFVTRDVVTYNGSALVSDKKNLVVEVSYQLYVNGRGAGEMICSPWDKKEGIPWLSVPARLYFQCRRCPGNRRG